jgi:RNA polymerase sigma-70 factor, ECF subfamily
MDEADLGRAFAQRQSWAYEAAYRRFGARMYTSALRILHDAGDAQDCVHEAMLYLWRRGDAYDPQRGSLEAFLTVCARNRALERRRRMTAHPDVALTAADDVAVTEAENDPIERARVARAVASLTPVQAKAIDLAYYRGMTHSEIAVMLDEPLGTVKSRIAGALRALRRALVMETANG